MGNVTYIRHGQASLFSDNYDQLSEKGKQQSFLLGSYFKKRKQKIDKIYLGPLNRHIQTLDAVLKSYSTLKRVPVEEMEALREHQGYKSLKAILPILLEKDQTINNLASLPFSNKKDQISHHIRLYDHFSQRWAKGEFDDYLKGKFQSWGDFYHSSSHAYNEIWNKVEVDEQVLVITSGGPTSVAYGLSNNLSHEEILRFSSSLYNGSRTHFKRVKNQIEVHTFNSIDHLDFQKELITLV